LGLATPEEIRSAKKRRGFAIREAVIARFIATRDSKGISIRSLAERSGLTRATIRNIERGEQSPSLETLVQLADGLEVDLPEILTDAIKQHPRPRES